MAPKSLFIMILVAVCIMSCRSSSIVDLCETDADVLGLVKQLRYDIVPIILIENKNARPFKDKADEDSIIGFYGSKNVPHLLVVTADTCTETDAYLNDNKKNKKYPELFFVKFDRLIDEKCSVISLDAVRNLYDIAEKKPYNGNRGKYLSSILELLIENKNGNPPDKRHKKDKEVGQSSTGPRKYRQLAPKPTGQQPTGPAAPFLTFTPPNYQPTGGDARVQWAPMYPIPMSDPSVNMIFKQPALQTPYRAYNPASVQPSALRAAPSAAAASPDVGTLRPHAPAASQRSAFKPVSTGRPGAVVPVKPSRPQEVTSILDRTKSTNVRTTRVVQPASSSPSGYEASRTRNLLGALEPRGENQYNRSGGNRLTTPTEYGGSETLTLGGTYAAKQTAARSSSGTSSGSSSGPSSGSATRGKQTLQLF